MLLFRRDGTLLAQPFDAASLKLVGDPLPIADRIGALGRYGIFSASTNGVLVYRTVPSGANASFLMSFSNDGRLSNSTLSDTTYSQVSVSRDGKHAAVVTLADPTNPSGYDIWIVDLVRRSKTRFTSDPTVDSSPVWSPKDDAIAFSSRRAGTFDIYLQPTSGTGSPETLVKSPEPKAPTDWSRDGQFLVYSSFDAKMKWDLWVLPMTGDRTPRPFLQTEFSEYQAQFSRDGKWIAYVSEESGTPEVYVLPFQQNTTGSVRWKVSDGGGQQPRWSRDGKSLFYLSRLSGSMREAKVISETPFKTAPGTAIPLDAAFYLGGNPSSGPPPIRWDLADASTFIVVGKPTSQSQSNSIHVVVNWQSDLKRKPATTR
jgi:Tol biopolymer transport system component